MKLLIFTYAPAGLGHLRVTDALVDSRPQDFPYLMLGSYDKFITQIHRFTSTNPIARFIFTISQYGLMEEVVTSIYRKFLVSASNHIYKQLLEIINLRKDVDEIWIVATHFGMAHQVGAVKDRLVKETGVKVKLVVQVTDDTSQKIWCVGGADIIFVPSEKTKNELEVYARKMKMSVVFEVSPYPICPALTQPLDVSLSRSETFESDSKVINVSVPVSGASVGISYIKKLISMVVGKSDRFRFWVIVKRSIYTEMFIKSLSKLRYVKLITGRSDNEMINLYERLFKNNLIHIEVTKPSEQAFKAILPPSLVGGSLMLFTSPVGRQEYDNVNFLIRKNLMPRSSFDYIQSETKTSRAPRAIRLSKDPEIAGNFILWGVNSGLFSKMSSVDFSLPEKSLYPIEVGPSGAKNFWIVMERYFGANR